MIYIINSLKYSDSMDYQGKLMYVKICTPRLPYIRSCTERHCQSASIL